MRPLSLLAVVAYANAGPMDAHFGAPPNVQCPPGFQLNGKNCERAIYGTPTIRCPVGALVNDQCIAHAPMTTQCPLGSVPEAGGECAVVESIAPNESCPPGFGLSAGGVCSQRVPLQLVSGCDIGHDNGQGECVQIEHAQKVIRTFCPPGYYDDLSGHGCMRITDYDCSPPLQAGKSEPVAAAPVAQAPFLPLSTKKNKYKRMLGARKYNVYAPAVVAAPPPSKSAMLVAAPSPVAPPPPAVQVVHQTCQRKDWAAPVVESECPPNFSDAGTSCQRVSTYPMTQKCANGAPANACFETKTAQRSVSCARGVLNGDVCQFKQPVPAQMMCPAGTIPSGSGDCQQITQPLATCPPGTYLDGRSCVGKETAAATGQVTKPCSGKECWV